MSYLYLVGLLLSAACMLLIDRRFRLFFFRDPRVAAVVTVVGLVFFLLWDFAGIGLGIFLVGHSAYMTGIMLAPEMPLEEPVFLAFLSLCTMILYTGAVKLLDSRAGQGSA
ncbi:lycopene cyclase domain-containing protein [Nesterenkonia lutea]|uniref:Lycopene cyclase domain-containing protein n=1 Tax=Nesterenkonia lutea TaxID=272919 RepID=A0ABR9JFS9_9MICC|nr:lycopene cyclase domain-containing protein [Nesterenkonia lutea]MBE1524792.1 lycopene cyclase domain-containing protein [Nesterenkonia lutea]